MSVSGIDDDSVNASLNESFHTLECISSNAYASSHSQATLSILTCHWLVLSLSDVLICDKADEIIIFIHYRQFLNLMLKKDRSSRIKVSLLMGNDKIILCHHIRNLAIHISLETQVTVCDNTHEFVVLIYHRNTSDVIFSHHIESVLYSLPRIDGHRIIDHAILGTLYYCHLTSLFLDRHILVDNADAAFASDSDSHRSLCDSVHCCCHEWDFQVNVTGKLGTKRYLTRKNLRVCRNEQYIIEGNTFHHYFVCNK